MSKLPTEKSVLEYLRKYLTKERLGHTMAVAYLAEKLAQKHGLNPAHARLAGLLHDSAKCWSGRELIKYAKKKKIKAPDFDLLCRHRPKLLHAYVGSHIAQREFKIKNKPIVSAIAKHTFGSVHMSPFEKCLYLADLASPDRKFSEAKGLRSLAMKDLHEAFLEGLKIKLYYTVIKGQWIHPESVRVWNRWVSS